MTYYDETIGMEVKNQKEADKILEGLILPTMTQGEREQYKRDQQAERLARLGLTPVSVPNKRSIGQKKRWDAVREEKRLANITEAQCNRLREAWGLDYNQKSEEG